MERKGREGEREGERSKGGCLSLPIQEVMETEQMRQVSSAIQDLDNQIEEQKLKIQNTANTSLRVSLCAFIVCIQATSKSGSVELCRVCLHGRLFCPLLSFCTQSYILHTTAETKGEGGFGICGMG